MGRYHDYQPSLTAGRVLRSEAWRWWLGAKARLTPPISVLSMLPVIAGGQACLVDGIDDESNDCQSD